MSYFEAIISGIVQGLTEFLPVSSSGHLVILHHYLGFKEPQLTFDIFLHVATLFAVIVYFWRDIIRIAKGQRKIFWFVIIGSIPTAFIGFFFKEKFEAMFSDIKVVGFMLFVTALFLFIGDWAGRRKEISKDAGSGLNWIKALAVGIIQGLSIIPGISRSGSTISSGMIFGIKKEDAIRFSFLLSIPAIIGALILKITDSSGFVITPQIFAGGIFAFFVGLLSIYILIRSVVTGRLKFFAIYCILIGGALLILNMKGA